MTKVELDPWGRRYSGIPADGHPSFKVQSPRDYLHMRTIRLMLRVVSGWPGKELGEKMLICEGFHHAVYNTFLSIVFFILQTWYLIENAKRLTFFALGHMYVALLMNVLSTSRGFTLCLSSAYRALAVKFLNKIHVFHYKNKSDYARSIYVKVHKLSNWFTVYLVTIMWLTLFLFNGVPPYLNYMNGKFDTFEDPISKNTSYELSIYFRLPYDPELYFNVYCYSLVLNWYAATLCTTSIIGFDLLLSIMIFNLWGHFKILLHALDTFPRPKALSSMNNRTSEFDKQTIMFSPEEQIEVAAKLKDNILYHRLIIDFTNQMSNIFGKVLFVYYTFHQVSGCLMLLECSQGPEALARYLPLTVMMTSQLIQISIIFETIGSMSEKIRDEVYCLPWEYMDSKNRATVQLFLINVQEPVHINAGGLVPVGVSTMAGILKTSASYFAFLRTMTN